MNWVRTKLKVSSRQILQRFEEIERMRPVGTDRSCMVILRDEYLTSQVCPVCCGRSMERMPCYTGNSERPVEELWSVLRCSNGGTCPEAWMLRGRNLVGCRNIARVHRHGIVGRRPA